MRAWVVRDSLLYMGHADSGRAAVLRYRSETSCIVPLPKCMYRALPLSGSLAHVGCQLTQAGAVVKRVFLFEFSMYDPPGAAAVGIMSPVSPTGTATARH